METLQVQPSARPSRWWVLPALSIAIALLGATWRWVDLEPRVEDEFFFAPGDPALRAENRIADRFGALSQVVILASGSRIQDPDYLDRIDRLTRAVGEVPPVVAVHSLTRGPDSLEDAQESPLWRRLLLAGDGSTSFLIAELQSSRAGTAVDALERILSEHTARGFELSLAGVPYTVEQMRTQLVRDFSVFSASAVVSFGLVILVVFRSGWILLGTLVTCGGAVAGTLVALEGFGFGIGLLTANLTTIVFVLAQSHVVFMTTNWQSMNAEGLDARARTVGAMKRTLPASLSSAVTTALGFGSLLFVPARPLQELGAGGTLGAVIALGAAYLAMPAFLAQASPRRRDRGGGGDARPAQGLRPVRAAAVALVCVGLASGLPYLNTDPSLLAYFDEEGEVHEALATLDRSGGSSPLSLVVQRSDRERLDSSSSQDRLWELHRALEEDAAVGRVVSLPLLIAEAERTPGVGLLKQSWIVDLIGPKTTGAFLTADRKQTLFLLQMAESERGVARSRVIERLEGLAERHDFHTPLVAGIYKLQARLAELVRRSMLWSLVALTLLFAGVSALAGASLRVGVAAALVLALVPLATLGSFGALGVPLDVIAAPAVSVGFGLAADAALHLISAWRRRRSDTRTSAWGEAIAEQWLGIVRATGIVALGFGLFALSSFPPTRRFGLGVAWATALGAVLAMWVLPATAQLLGARAPRCPGSRGRWPRG